MSDLNLTYICNNCGKEFKRKRDFEEGEEVLCRGCQISKYYKDNPEKSIERQKKSQLTSLKKYGTSNPAKSNEIKKKISQNISDAYNDRKEDILNKRTSTNKERFGYNFPAQNKEILNKGLETQRSRQGCIGWENKELQKSAEERAHSPESNEKRKNTSIKNYGVYSVVGSSGNSNRLKGYEYDSLRFDSGWELAIYVWCKDNDVPVVYHPNFHFTYEDENGNEHIYWPDFLIKGQFYETKGDQFFNDKDEPYNKYTKTFWWSKYNALTKNNVKILRKADMIPYLKYVNDTYGKDFIKSFKVK